MASMRGEHSVDSVQNRTKPNGPKMEISFFPRAESGPKQPKLF